MVDELSLVFAQITPESATAWSEAPLAALLIAALIYVVVAFTLGDSVFFGVVPAKQHKQLREDCEERLEKIRNERDAVRKENADLWRERIEEAKASAELAEAYLTLRQAEREKKP